MRRHECPTGQQAGIKRAAVLHAISLSDVFYDAFHNFSPTYNEYTLYSDGQQTVTKRGKARASPGVEEDEGGSRTADKAGLLSSMEMGTKWKTTEEGIVTDFSTLARIPEVRLCVA